MTGSKGPGVVADLIVENHGSIYLLRAATKAGGEFLMDAESDAQYFGGALVVEPRYVPGVVDLAIERGLVVR